MDESPEAIALHEYPDVVSPVSVARNAVALVLASAMALVALYAVLTHR